MSRGWESKSVESQQASQQAEASEAKPTPAQAKANLVEMRGNIAADAERKRQVQALQLQRERVLSERTSNPHRRSALEAALIDIEEKLSELGWTIHL
jgi:hypothetical protein